MATPHRGLRKLFSIEYITQNKLTVFTIAILLVMLFMIGRTLIHAIHIGHDSAILRSEAARYQERITADSTLIESLKFDSELERYARENYFLQRSNEEIFILE